MAAWRYGRAWIGVSGYDYPHWRETFYPRELPRKRWLEHAIRHFDYDTVGPVVNANIAHDHGFFVGNHPRDLGAEIAELRDVLDRAARPAASHATA